MGRVFNNKTWAMDTGSSNDNTLHDSGGAVEKTGVFKLKEQLKALMVILHAMC